MQVNLNCNGPKTQQSFGMAIHSNENVDKILIKRIKKVTDAEKLKAIFKNQESNDKVDITLLANPNDSIEANICPKAYTNDNWFCIHCSEGIINKLFKGPVSFIEKLANIADKKAAEITKQEEIANALKF